MKTKTTTLLILLTFLLTSGFRKMSENSSSPDKNSKFTLVRSDENISIYTRWIPATKTRMTREIKAEFIIDSPVNEIVSVLKDEKLYTQWMKSTKSYYRLKTTDENNWYAYIQFSIPWPLNNQDCILKYRVHENEDSSKTEIKLLGEPGFLKTYEGIERISHMEGSWIITRIDSQKSLVEYYMYSNQAPKFPTWITDPLIQKNLLKTMNALRDLIMNN